MIQLWCTVDPWQPTKPWETEYLFIKECIVLLRVYPLIDGLLHTPAGTSTHLLSLLSLVLDHCSVPESMSIKSEHNMCISMSVCPSSSSPCFLLNLSTVLQLQLMPRGWTEEPMNALIGCAFWNTKFPRLSILSKGLTWLLILQMNEQNPPGAVVCFQ